MEILTALWWMAIGAGVVWVTWKKPRDRKFRNAERFHSLLVEQKNTRLEMRQRLRLAIEMQIKHHDEEMIWLAEIRDILKKSASNEVASMEVTIRKVQGGPHAS